MRDPRHYRLTQKLIEYSARLEDLTLEVRRLGPESITAELLDELAVTADELLLTLDEHRRVRGDDELTGEVIADARALARGVRSLTLPRERVAEAADGVTRSLGRVIGADKRAA